VYGTRGTSSAASRLDVLMELERIRDPWGVPFLLRLLGDRQESADVRIHVVKQLRHGSGLLVLADRPSVAQIIGDVLEDTSPEELRVQAALALGDFTRIDGVLSRLSAVALAGDASLDLRYAAFTSIERTGPAPESIAVLCQIGLSSKRSPTWQWLQRRARAWRACRFIRLKVGPLSDALAVPVGRRREPATPMPSTRSRLRRRTGPLQRVWLFQPGNGLVPKDEAQAPQEGPVQSGLTDDASSERGAAS
jgi:hypothetical protein